MRILVVQNFDNTGLGQIATALDERGASIDLVQAHKGEALPAHANGHDALVVLGGGQNARDDEAYPYLPRLADLMRSFAEEDRAVLGVCLGSQILARAYGAENLIGTASEFGWQEVSLTEEGKADPIFGKLPERFAIFQWHDDTFTLPEGAARLAYSQVAANQAFRVGRAAYAVQFHFEADRKLVGEWNIAFAEFLAERQPGWALRHPAEAERHGPAADAVGLALARAWVAVI